MKVSIIGHVININTVFTVPTTDHSYVDGLLKDKIWFHKKRVRQEVSVLYFADYIISIDL